MSTLQRVRGREAVLAAISALVARGISAAVALVTLPILIGTLGTERYGVWIAISSIAGWLALMDLGIGNGLQTAVAKASVDASGQAMKSAISSAAAVGAAVVLATWAVVQVLVPELDWVALLNTGHAVPREELVLTVRVTTTLLLVSTWTSQGYAIARGLRLIPVVNLSTIGAGAVALSATYLVARPGVQLPVLALALLLPPAAAPLLLWAWLGLRNPLLRPALRRDLIEVGSTIRTGGGFLLLQLAVLFVLQFDAFLISHYCGPSEVTPYSVASRVLAIGALGFTAYSNAHWPIYAEAAALGQWQRIDRTYRWVRFVATAGVGAVSLGFVGLGSRVISAWLGDAAVGSDGLYLWLAVAVTIRAWTDSHAMVLNGVLRLAPQLWSASIHAALSVGLGVVLAPRWGAPGVVAGGALAYAALSAWWLPLAVRRTVRVQSESAQ